MHVLEHLGDPSEYINYIISKLVKGAFLYIEVPLEIDEFYLNNLKNKNIFVTLHEHINKYCERSLKLAVNKNNIKFIDFYANENLHILVQKIGE